MFKKTLIALAVASASTMALGAADIATNTISRTVSVEGASSLTNVNADLVQIDLGAEYAVNDVITITFSGADLDTATAPLSINPTLVDPADTMTLGLLSASATELTYRVTELTLDGANAETTIGATIVFAADALEFDAAGLLLSGSVDATYSAATSTGVTVDAPAGNDGTANLLTTATQISAVVTTGFDETIDVNQQRLGFVGPATTDAIVITPTNNSAGVLFDATVNGMTYTLNGDWTILDNDPATAGVQVNAGAIAIAGGGTLTSVDASTIVIDHAGVAAQTVTIDVEGVAASGDAFDALAVQTFTVDVEAQFTDHGTDSDPTNGGTAAVAGTSDLLTGSAGGEWDLNGSVINVSYIPFGPVTQPIIRYTNKGSQSGDITARYMVEGTHTTWQDLGTLFTNAAPGVRNMLAEVTAALTAEGFDASTTGFKVTLEVTSNVPAGDINIFVGAKITTSTSDRLSIGNF